MLDNRCIIFSTIKCGEEWRMAPRGEVNGASKASMTPVMGDNKGKVKGVGALHREDWCLLAHFHMVD
ncbi:hypothetical protein MUK42_10567 [Musa troglodytarum]|uniref:Uncharacterized protein n=1 Tax=Musa troglodytarum TaxID=320322 RepID=A0A9E7KGM6_9LILI|nr:hypothetical protein MUK42_10567 [Musa troglodytarum]